MRVGGQAMIGLRARRLGLPRTGQVRMLGNFDTYLLGWKDREFAVTGEHALHVKEGGGGWIRPVVVEDGIVLGGWRSRRQGGRLEVTLFLDEAERERLRGKVEAEVADIGRFEGTEVVVVG
jgi:DNA glycosylase AlkZ-like